MNFSLTEEQSLLQDSIAKYLANGYSFEERRRIAATEDGFCRDHWAEFADLGWLTVPIPVDAGGFGGSWVEDDDWSIVITAMAEVHGAVVTVGQEFQLLDDQGMALWEMASPELGYGGGHNNDSVAVETCASGILVLE